MREFALGQTETLLGRFGHQVNRAARNSDPDAVHDLRVSIRRLSRCLRVFAQFYPDSAWKKIRRRLKTLMECCGAVRDRDIALELLTKAGFQSTSIVMLRLNLERAEALEDLTAELRRWKPRTISREWRAELGL
jgi:CHAD domain-containing protein